MQVGYALRGRKALRIHRIKWIAERVVLENIHEVPVIVEQSIKIKKYIRYRFKVLNTNLIKELHQLKNYKQTENEQMKNK